MVAFNYFFGKDSKTKDECNTPATTSLIKQKPLGACTPGRSFIQGKKQVEIANSISNTFVGDLDLRR